MTRWALLALLMAAAACRTKPATQLLVAVGTDIEVGDTLEQIEVEVGPSDGTSVFSRRTILVSRNPSPPFSVAMPFTFGVVPQGDDASRQVRVVARGRFRASGRRDRVVVTAITGFIEERSLLLPLYLQQRCVDVLECADGFTCRDGMCVDARVSTSTLREVGVGFDPTLAFDASTSDATAADASDAGGDVTDSTAADAGDLTDAAGMDVTADVAMDAGVDVAATDVTGDVVRDGAMDAGADEGTVTFDGGRLDSTTGSEASVLDAGPSDGAAFEGGLTRDLPIATDDVVMGVTGFQWVAPNHGAWLSSAAPRLRWRGTFPPGTAFRVCFCETEACPTPRNCTPESMVSPDASGVATLTIPTTVLSDVRPGWLVLSYGPSGAATTVQHRVFVHPATASSRTDDRPAWRAVLDVNGDSILDLAVGAMMSSLGQVRVYGGYSESFAEPFSGPTSDFGGVIASLGDVDGDGLSDLALASMPGAGDAGLTLYRGRRAVRPAFNTLGFPIPASAPGYFATSFAAAGDLNRDGFDDVITGSGPTAQWFTVYYGSGMGVTPAATRVCPVESATPGFTPRAAVGAGVGDFDGDGFVDLAVAAPAAAGSAGAANAIFVYPGGVSGVACAARRVVSPPAGRPADWGLTVVPAGDVNADGFADFLVTHAGGVDVVYGAASSVTPTVAAVAAPAGQCMGAVIPAGAQWQAAGVGDLDGDGRTDVATGVFNGCAFLFRHNGSVLAWARTLTGITSSTTLPTYARALGALGDTDRDGHPDFAVSGLDDSTSQRVVAGYLGAETIFGATPLTPFFTFRDTTASEFGRSFAR